MNTSQRIDEQQQAMDTLPEVQVFIPVYNGEYIQDALRSVLAQRDVNLEVVVVDNSSTDASYEHVRAIAALDPRVVARQHDENIGMIPNFNACVKAATAPFFMLLCSDDVFYNDRALFLALQVAKDPNVVSVYSDLQYIDGNGRKLSTRRFRRQGLFDAEDTMRSAIRTNRNTFGIPLLHRTSALAGLEYPEDFPYSADVFLSYAVAQRGLVYHIPKLLIGNRFTGENATAVLLQRTRRELLAQAKRSGFPLSRTDRILSGASFLPIVVLKKVFLKVSKWRNG